MQINGKMSRDWEKVGISFSSSAPAPLATRGFAACRLPLAACAKQIT